MHHPAPLPHGLKLHATTGIDGISARDMYAIAQLRLAVFGIEQDCIYQDLDGRDLEPSTQQLWLATEAGELASSIRVLDESHEEPGLVSIGRVVTAPAWRGKGVAGALLEHAIGELDGHSILIHAQAHLQHWYARFGFQAFGEEFLEDGIPHIAMRIR